MEVEITQICYQSMDLVIVHANSDTFLKTNFYYIFRIRWFMKLFYEISLCLSLEIVCYNNKPLLKFRAKCYSVEMIHNTVV
jgi:hypothetical protein